MGKRISVVMATYNGGKYLKEQLDSLYSQTRIPDEVIVSDDCSIDNTVEILYYYHSKYNLKYTVNSENIGFNRNFEKVLNQASGDYIMICDQDDVWFKHKVSTLFDAITEREDNKPCVICSGVIDVDRDLVPLKKMDKNYIIKDWTYNLHGAFSQGCTMIMNRAALNRILPFPERYMFDVYIGIAVNMIGKWYDIGIPLMFYRHHECNVIAKKYTATKKSLKNFYSKDPIPFIITTNRLYIMDYVYNRFFNEIIPEKKDLFNQIRSYRNLSKLHCLYIIVKNPWATIRLKIKSIISLFLS